ncbi:hypothetical protein TOK_1691 [Pseudonocardia sp. N23]|nr:hypothetical protein TOK_1691 [Pseudonocardia sp. N23]
MVSVTTTSRPGSAQRGVRLGPAGERIGRPREPVDDGTLVRR